MTAQDTINFALAARGLTPLRFKCECCGDEYDRDEVAEVGRFLSKTNIDAIHDRFGKLVCEYCALDMLYCDATGVALKDDEGERDPETGELYASDEVLAEVQADRADNEQHIADERRALSPFGGRI